MTRDAYVRLGRGVFRLPCNKSTESSDDPGVSSPDDVSTTVATVPVDVSPTFTEYVPSWDTKGACLVHGAVCVHGGDDLCTLQTGSSSNSGGDCDCDCDCDSDSGSGCANVRGKSGCTKFSYTLCVCVCFCVRGWVRVH